MRLQDVTDFQDVTDMSSRAEGPSARLDHAEFRLVYATHYPSLVRLAYLTTDSLAVAEEVAQDAFVEWLRRGSQIRDPLAYLRRAVISRCTSWVRRRRLERRHGTIEIPVIPPIGDDDVQAVRAVLRGLTTRQRAAVFMRFYLDLSETEIAQALNCRPGTVKSLLHRALAAMKEELDDVH